MQTRLIHRRAEGRRTAGFSLAELMVVIVIISLLATAVVPRVMDSLMSAKWGTAKSDIMVIQSALTQYAIQNGGAYPDSLEALVERDVNNRKFLDRDSVPTDPWGTEYGYEPPSGGEPDPIITCFGKDGTPGGEGDERDVTNIDIKNKRDGIN